MVKAMISAAEGEDRDAPIEGLGAPRAYLGLRGADLRRPVRALRGGTRQPRHFGDRRRAFHRRVTNDNERGLGGWNVADSVAYLKNGHNAISASTGIIAEEISRSS
jgi:hypothetical protein